MQRSAVCFTLTTLVVVTFATPQGEGIQLESQPGLVPVSGFVFNEDGEAVEGAVVILDIKDYEGVKYWIGMVTPEDGHYFLLAPEGYAHLKCYYGSYLIQRLSYRYGMALDLDYARAYNLYLDDFIAARDSGDPVLSTPAKIQPAVIPVIPAVEPTTAVEPAPTVEPTTIEGKGAVESALVSDVGTIPTTPGSTVLPLHIHAGGGLPFIGDFAVGFSLHRNGYLNLTATLVYVDKPEEHLARTGDLALSLDYDLYLGGTLRAHLGIGPGVYFRTDETLFTLKVKAGLAVIISPNMGITLGADYYPIIGDVYFGESLNPRVGVDFFF